MLERFIGFEPYEGTNFGVAWTEKYRFEIINAVTDEPKGTIFSVYSLMF